MTDPNERKPVSDGAHGEHRFGEVTSKAKRDRTMIVTPSSGRGRFWVFVLMFLLVAAIVALGFGLWQERQARQAVRADVAVFMENAKDLSGALNEIREKLAQQDAAIAKGLTQSNLPLAEWETLKGRISSLEEGTSRLSSEWREALASLSAAGEPTDAALAAELARLKSEQGQLQRELQDIAARPASPAAATTPSAVAIGLALLLDRLNARIEAGQSFAEPLDLLQQRIEAGSEMAKFIGEALTLPKEGRGLSSNWISYAGEGLPTEADLAEQLSEMAPRITALEQGDPEGDWLDRTVAELSSLISIRPIGENAEGEGIAARIARAEAAVWDGDLAQAVTELEAVPAPAQDLLSVWLRKASALMAAQRALAAAEDRLLAYFMETGASVTPANTDQE